MKNNYFIVGSFQGNGLEKNPDLALEKILQATKEADDQAVDVLCTPESYLHGYLKTREEAQEYSIDLQSSTFADICSLFKNFKTTLLLGLNESMGNKLYNTTVVIEQGKCLGTYRKAYTYAPYDYFALGNEFPVFKKDNIPYGIVICCDINFFEPARILALKRAKILFCPMWNRISKDAKMLVRMHNKSHFMGRAFDNHCYIVTSDIVWDESDAETCPGYSCIIGT